jgi:hypothetical protein
MARTITDLCLACGETLQPGDHYCGICGTAVQPHQAGGPSLYDPEPPRRTGRRVVAVVAAFLAVAAVSGLVVAFIDARRDLDDEQVKLSVAQTQIVDLSKQLTDTADPDQSLQRQLAAAESDLADVRAELTQTQADLEAERAARTADAATADAAKTTELAAIQTQLDAANAQLTALTAMFPLSEDTFRSASPAGDYAVTIAPIECTLVGCLELKSLTLSFPDATKVSGNRANGIIAYADGSYTATGPLEAAQAPLCNGAETDATFSLAFHASRVTFENGLLVATELTGSYRETVSSGDCTGQFRSYSISMIKQ